MTPNIKSPVNNVTSMNIKKIVPWGNGLALYLTKESRKLGWDKTTTVIISVIEEKNGSAKLEVRRAPVNAG